MTLKGLFLWRGGVKCWGGDTWKTVGGEFSLEECSFTGHRGAVAKAG